MTATAHIWKHPPTRYRGADDATYEIVWKDATPTGTGLACRAQIRYGSRRSAEMMARACAAADIVYEGDVDEHGAPTRALPAPQTDDQGAAD